MEGRTVGRQQKNQQQKKEKRLSGWAAFFIREVYMKLDRKKAIEIIVKAAQNYEHNLKDKRFLIIYQRAKEAESVQVEFRGNHFLHLTGVKTKLSAQRFYEKCLNNKLALSDIELDPKGRTQQKLAVLPFLHELLYHNCMIGEFINSGIYIRADYFVGNTKAVLSVGFRTGRRADFPVTLYKEDVRRLSNPTRKVLAILVKDHMQKVYSQYAYISKGVDIQKLLMECKEERSMLV